MACDHSDEWLFCIAQLRTMVSATFARMSRTRLPGRGRLVPTRPTGIAYQVRHGIQLVGAVPNRHGRGLRSARWAKCSVRLTHVGRIPNGRYFLYTDEGRVYQLMSIDGRWEYLAAAD